jgi:hypothetical protein
LRFQELPLHRVKLAVRRETLDGRDLESRGTMCRYQAAVYRFSIEPDRASAAVTGVASLLHTEPAKVAQESAQALPGGRVFGKRLTVDVV